MRRVTSTKCYIEEYRDEQGRLVAQLREMVTGRKVDLGLTTSEEIQHYPRFGGAAEPGMSGSPEPCCTGDAEDCIVVSGELDFDGPDEIRFRYNENLSYLYA